MDNELIKDQSEAENSKLDEEAVDTADAAGGELEDDRTVDIFDLGSDNEPGDDSGDGDGSGATDDSSAAVDSDAGDDSGDSDESADGDGRNVKVKAKIKLIDPEYTKRLPFSFIAALIGALLGIVPAIMCAYWFGALFYPFFIAAPILIYVFNILLKGCRDIRAPIINAVFSLVSTYTGIVVYRVALIILHFDISIIRLPRYTFQAFGLPEVLPASASSYLYPLLFTVLGIAVIWELTRFTRNNGSAKPEAVADPELSSKFDIQNPEGEAAGVDATGEGAVDGAGVDAVDGVEEDAADDAAVDAVDVAAVDAVDVAAVDAADDAAVDAVDVAAVDAVDDDAVDAADDAAVDAADDAAVDAVDDAGVDAVDDDAVDAADDAGVDAADDAGVDAVDDAAVDAADDAAVDAADVAAVDAADVAAVDDNTGDEPEEDAELDNDGAET